MLGQFGPQYRHFPGYTATQRTAYNGKKLLNFKRFKSYNKDLRDIASDKIFIIFNQETIVAIPGNIKGKHAITARINTFPLAYDTVPPAIVAGNVRVSRKGMVDENNGSAVQGLPKMFITQRKIKRMARLCLKILY